MIESQSRYGVPPVAETGLSFIENALIKARHVARATGVPSLADDSGLVVGALNGAPGIYSARFAGSRGDDAANIDLLLEKLRNTADRRAFFYCALALIHDAHDATPLIVSARWSGRISKQPLGSAGFGYDPVFFVPAQNRTAAQMAPACKDRLSHRGQALDALLTAMQDDPRWQ